MFKVNNFKRKKNNNLNPKSTDHGGFRKPPWSLSQIRFNRIKFSG